MANRYVTGYNGITRSLEELQQWSHWKGLDPELQRRLLALMDASIVAGRPIGIGEIVRSTEQQTNLFLSRHYEVASGGCCTYQGKHYQLRSGVAHAAPPGSSYHEPTTPDGKSLAIDTVGDMRWLDANCKAYGFMTFALINSEPWHIQGTDYPTGRKRYVAAVHSPLSRFQLPALPPTAPTRVYAPSPTLKQGGQNDKMQVRNLQMMMNFWGWKDAQGRTLVVDGDYAIKTDQAVRNMQKALSRTIDGVYGAQTALSLQQFLDAMASLR